ncbi:MAG: bifunctional aspartate kinase/homoserine dehydrogenase II [Chromatiaceae bacterium]|nr:bifunctional aspartate kinase/homoserine dehydrogenase II [Chromatiaceae bacterium]
MHSKTLLQPQQAAQVHKFGGSSLADANRFAAIAKLVQQLHQQAAGQALWLVVSAPGDTTDALLNIIASSDNEAQYQPLLSALQQQLANLVQQALSAEGAVSVLAQLQQWLAEVPTLLTQQRHNEVLAIGERLSALLLSAVLSECGLNAAALDARDFLRLNQHQPDLPQSASLLAALTQTDTIHVVTGFIARDEHQRSITLGRNGSDYSATLLGALVHATEVTIWTDVKAIYSADPRKVATALPYQQVSWQQACQLARLGNPVLHARTLSALTGTATRLRVRSSYQPVHQGCQVQQQVKAQHFITELNDVTLLTLAAGSYDTERLALQLQQPVVTLAQHSDHVIWLLPANCAEQALALLAAEHIHAVWDTRRYHALAWLKGEQAIDASANLLPQALHRYENEQQLIWLLPTPLNAEQLQQLHQALVTPAAELKLVVAGSGNVGGEFLAMLAHQQQRLQPKVKLSLAGIMNSRQALLQSDIAPTDWAQALAETKSWDSDSLLSYLQSLPAPKVLVDITPSADFARLYPKFIAAGCDIISANKQGVTLPGSEYQCIQQALTDHQRQWLSNTTCGAGIPVQRSLQELLSAGDRIRQISGIFSGTLSWLFCQFDGSKPFSDFVLEAQQAGLTEPDPRDDLSGKDVQRKLLVLARELGLTLELEDIQLQPLLPAELEQGSWQQFWAQCDVLDDAMAQLFAQATAQGKLLRYVACLTLQDEGALASVALQAVSPVHPLAAIAPCDNVFVIESDWYSSNPLVLKGPGAGKQVTAGGLHADLAQLIDFYFRRDQPATLT